MSLVQNAFGRHVLSLHSETTTATVIDASNRKHCSLLIIMMTITSSPNGPQARQIFQFKKK